MSKYECTSYLCTLFDIQCCQSVGETGVHWDTGSIGTPPLVENLQHTEPMRCHFMDAWEPPLYKSIITKKIMQYKKVGE